MSDMMKRFEAAKRHARVTWAEIAREIGVTQQVINNWRRRGKIPGDQVPRAAGALGVNTDWLALGKGTMLPGTAIKGTHHAAGVAEPRPDYPSIDNDIQAAWRDLPDNVRDHLRALIFSYAALAQTHPSLAPFLKGPPQSETYKDYCKRMEDVKLNRERPPPRKHLSK